MAFFAVQVQTGFEIQTKEMLKQFLTRAGDSMVKAIYALETFTECIEDNKTDFEVSELNNEDISDHLQIQRLQSGLTNLRNQYDALRNHKDTESINLLNTYKDQMRKISKKIKEFRASSKKISSLLSGYILVELNINYHYIPDHLWHLIKSVPRVINLVSKYNIQKEEVESFFQQIDMTPEIEIQFEELLNTEEIEELESELLQEANQVDVVGTKEEVELLEQIDNLHTNVIEEVNEFADEIADATPTTSPIKPLFDRLKCFVRRKREVVTLSVTLFKELYDDVDMRYIRHVMSGKDFLSRLRSLVTPYDKEVLE